MLICFFPFLFSDSPRLRRSLNHNGIKPMFSFQHQLFWRQNELTKFYRASIFRKWTMITQLWLVRSVWAHFALHSHTNTHTQKIGLLIFSVMSSFLPQTSFYLLGSSLKNYWFNHTIKSFVSKYMQPFQESSLVNSAKF